jgi:hypothetical protein
MARKTGIYTTKGGAGKTNLAVALYHRINQDYPCLYSTNDRYSPQLPEPTEEPIFQLLDFGGWEADLRILNEECDCVFIPTNDDILSIRAALSVVESLSNPNIFVVGTKCSPKDMAMLEIVFDGKVQGVFRFRNSTATPTSIVEEKSPWVLAEERPLLKRAWSGLFDDVEAIYNKIIEVVS